MFRERVTKRIGKRAKPRTWAIEEREKIKREEENTNEGIPNIKEGIWERVSEGEKERLWWEGRIKMKGWGECVEEEGSGKGMEDVDPETKISVTR